MRKFIVNCVKDNFLIIEVECEKVSAITDASVMWMNPGEWKAKIIAPNSLFEKDESGKLISPIWCWHSFLDFEEECFARIRNMIKVELFRAERKSLKENQNSIPLNQDEINKKIEDCISKVRVVYLK